MSVESAAELPGDALIDAVKTSIAEEAGISPDDITSVEVTFKVTGGMTMQVSDPAAFVASASAKEGVERALAMQIGVFQLDVTATLSIARRLSVRAMQSSSVDVAFEIAVADGAAADSVAQTMSSASSDELAQSINEVVDDRLPQVTGVEEVTAAPEVVVAYEITPTSTAMAQSLSEAMASANPAAFASSVNEDLQSQGVETRVTVSEISAPELAGEEGMETVSEISSGVASAAARSGPIAALAAAGLCAASAAAALGPLRP